MISSEEWDILIMCFEGFLFGKVSFPCALTCTPAKEVQLFPGLLGIYSGIFAIYIKLQFTSKDSRKTTVVFYALCLLYVLSTATVIIDFLVEIIGSEVSNNSFLLLVMLIYYRFNFRMTYSLYSALRLSKAQ